MKITVKPGMFFEVLDGPEFGKFFDVGRDFYSSGMEYLVVSIKPGLFSGEEYRQVSLKYMDNGKDVGLGMDAIGRLVERGILGILPKPRCKLLYFKWISSGH